MKFSSRRARVFLGIFAGLTGLVLVLGTFASGENVVVTLAESLLQTFPEAHLRQILFLYAMVALSTAMCLTVLEKFRLPAEESLTRIAPDILLLVFGGVIIVAFCFTTGNHQFGGYDLSSVIDLGWRQYLGQRPYRDFVCTVPIGYVLAVGAAFRIGGPLWNSSVLGAAFLGLVSWGWNYALVRKLTAKPSGRNPLELHSRELLGPRVRASLP